MTTGEHRLSSCQVSVEDAGNERKIFTSLDRGGDHITLLQRKYFLARLVLKPAISIG